jgi:hypothetical protein
VVIKSGKYSTPRLAAPAPTTKEQGSPARRPARPRGRAATNPFTIGSARPDSHTLPRARLTPTVTPQVRETGRHCAPRPPSTVSRPQFQPVGRADDFECESVLCSSQRRAESNRAVVRVFGAALRQAACGKTKRHAAGRGPRRYPVAYPSRAPCCFPVARHETSREFRRRCRTRRCAATEHATRERAPR